VTATITQ